MVDPFLILAALLLAWNLVTFVMMGVDKYKAKKGGYRISEKTLLLSALCFGSAGALLGMNCFRHKTRHWYFRIGLPVFLILQIGLAIFLIYWPF